MALIAELRGKIKPVLASVCNVPAMRRSATKASRAVKAAHTPDNISRTIGHC